MGETLWTLASRLNRMQQHQNQHPTSHQARPLMNVSKGKQEESNFSSQADMFARNAEAILVKRAPVAVVCNRPGNGDSSDSYSSLSPLENAISQGAPTNPSPSVSSKWKKVTQAVHFAGAAKNVRKKTDAEPTQDEQLYGVEEEDEELGNASFSESTKEPTVIPKKSRLARAKDHLSSDFHDFEEWLKFRQLGILQYCRWYLLFVILPSLAAAIILFYLAGNPPCGTTEECFWREINRNITLGAEQAKTVAPALDNETATAAPSNPNVKVVTNLFRRRDIQASASYWIIFLGVRQVITFLVAKVTEAILVDFMALKTNWFVKIFRPFFTLFVVQSKGLPVVFFFWALYDLAFLHGSNNFAKHWLFWQSYIDIFNDSNPAGGLTTTKGYRSALVLALACSAVVAAKRFWVGLFLGRKTFSRYATDLAKAMRKILLIGQVAALARDMEKHHLEIAGFHVSRDFFQPVDDQDSGAGQGSLQHPSTNDGKRSLLANCNLAVSQRVKVDELLGAWEEPEEAVANKDMANIGEIIQFRQSLSCLNTHFPFSVPFGPASTRTECVASSEKVYNRLTLSTPGRGTLSFDTLALIAVRADGTLDETKFKELVRLLRPDREGNLSLLDFAKSIDAVYKELRLLRASVSNSSKMDRAFEGIINIFFYTLLVCIVLAVLGINPMVLFASISGFILGFAFMIGAACSKYFEGVLLILVRHPYDIGDLIHVSAVNNDTSSSGSSGWVVKDVNLFTTTVVYAATNEVATYSNGSLAASRIINAARSPQAYISFFLKFPINTSYEKLQVFKASMEKFVKARPREWLSLIAFRATRVEVDQSFVEYIVFAQHRESWQQIGALNSSKAELSSFALELSKKMNMRYRLPPMPIDIAGVPPLKRSLNDDEASQGSVDISSVAALFDKK